MVHIKKAIKSITFVEETVNRNLTLNAVRQGLVYMIPVALIGSLALVVISLPVPFYQNAMHAAFGDGWKDALQYVRNGTFGIMSLIMVVCIGYSYTVEYSGRHGQNTNPAISAVISLGAFVALSGFGKKEFSLANFGVIGAFIAIAVAVTSSALYVRLSRLRIFQIKGLSSGANALYDSAISSILPAAVIFILFAGINEIMSAAFGIVDLQVFLSNALNTLFHSIRSGFLKAFLFIGLIHGFWFFGMHGSNILEPVAQSVFNTQQAMSSGIFNKTFFDTFVLIGGCGSALSLVLALFIAGKRRNQKRLAKLSMLPILFNINELVIFGLPIVLNPIYLIPFMLTPLLLTAVSYLAVWSGLVPHSIHLVEWTTPVLLSGYTATGSIRGSALQLINLCLGVACYAPFVKLADLSADSRLNSSLNKLYSAFRGEEEKGAVMNLLVRQDEIGNIARALAVDLEHDLKNNRMELHYQPQVDYAGSVFGVEALLRWKHKDLGYIYPPLVIALAEQRQLIDKLGFWILDTAFRDLAKLNRIGINEVDMSVNVSAKQIDDPSFTDTVRGLIQANRVNARQIKLEITEQVALSNARKIIERIEAIRSMGIKLAMDDFGMGHSSLMYLKEYEFDTIKLDGALIHEIATSGNCQNIVASIIYLGESLHYNIIAEYVEDPSQRSRLHELGCDKYQGYLFSKALPFKELVAYLIRMNAVAQDGQAADKIG